MNNKCRFLRSGLFRLIAVVFAAYFYSTGLYSCRNNDVLADQKENVLKSATPDNYQSVYWGPERFERKKGAPLVENRIVGSADLQFFESNFELHIRNGDEQDNIPLKAVIKLDGQQLTGPSAIMKNKNTELVIPVTGLTTDSQLEVELLGKPGSSLDIWITGKLKIIFGTFNDSRDGRNYRTVKIKGQEWMTENLAYLPAVSEVTTGSETDPHYYVYDYNGTDILSARQTNNYSVYGVLYNWPAALEACPSGWHLPSDDEWKQLEMALGMTLEQTGGIHWRGTDQGAQMKSFSGWLNNGNGTNTIGFSCLPGGYRDRYDYFGGIGQQGYWWSSTEDLTYGAWFRTLADAYSTITRGQGYKDHGFSVRCIRN